jgi:hypothetical protein
MSISEIKKKYNITSAQIADLNPDISRPVIRSQGLLPKGYVLKLPAKPEDSLMTVSGSPNS